RVELLLNVLMKTMQEVRRNLFHHNSHNSSKDDVLID
ncbi:hypothetical protein CEXT_222731, partial [Caerostris extrusa]